MWSAADKVSFVINEGIALLVTQADRTGNDGVKETGKRHGKQHTQSKKTETAYKQDKAVTKIHRKKAAYNLRKQ